MPAAGYGADRCQGCNGRLVRAVAEGRAAILEDHCLNVADMGIAHGRGNAAIGHDATDNQCFDARTVENPFEPALIKG